MANVFKYRADHAGDLAVGVQPGFADRNVSIAGAKYKKLHLAGVVARRYRGFEM